MIRVLLITICSSIFMLDGQRFQYISCRKNQVFAQKESNRRTSLKKCLPPSASHFDRCPKLSLTNFSLIFILGVPRCPRPITKVMSITLVIYTVMYHYFNVSQNIIGAGPCSAIVVKIEAPGVQATNSGLSYSGNYKINQQFFVVASELITFLIYAQGLRILTGWRRSFILQSYLHLGGQEAVGKTNEHNSSEHRGDGHSGNIHRAQLRQTQWGQRKQGWTK